MLFSKMRGGVLITEIRERAAATTDDIPSLAYLRWEMDAKRHPERQAAMTREDCLSLYAAILNADIG